MRLSVIVWLEFDKVLAELVGKMVESGTSASCGCRSRFLTESIALAHWIIELESLKLRNCLDIQQYLFIMKLLAFVAVDDMLC